MYTADYIISYTVPCGAIAFLGFADGQRVILVGLNLS